MTTFLYRTSVVLACCISVFTHHISAQTLPCPPTLFSTAWAGNDTTVCLGNCATLSGSSTTNLKATNTYSADTIPYNPSPFNAGTPILVNIDDTWSSVLPLTFPFCYFGQFYNSVVIGSNGNVSFDLANANAFNAFSVNNAIPFNYSSYNNCILSPFFDMDPTVYGNIRYATYGTAPCRKFVISYDSVSTYNCITATGGGCPYKNSQQIILYETINVIEIHVKNHNYYSGSTSQGYAVLGIQNDVGTIAYSFPGRNNAQWNENNKAYRFTPSGSPTVTYEWTDLNTNAVVGVGQTLQVCPTLTTDYKMRAIFTTACDSFSLYDTVKVTIDTLNSIDSFHFTNPTICGKNDGTITLFGVDSGQSFTVNYDKNGVPQPTLSLTSSNNGTLAINFLKAGTYSNIMIGVGPCITGPIGPVTLIDPQFSPNFDYTIGYACDQDTVKFTDLSQVVGTYTDRWNFGDGNTSILQNPVHVYLNQNVYNVTLIIDNGYCKDSVMKPIDITHPLIAAFTTDKDSICAGGSITFTNTSTTTTKNGINPSYMWYFGDGGTSIDPNPVYQFNTEGIYQVMMVVTDFVPCNDTVYKTIVVDPNPVVAIQLSDSLFCEGSSVIFTAQHSEQGLVETKWDLGDGMIVLNKDTVVHAYDTSGQFTVSFTAHYRICGDVTLNKTIDVKPQPVIDLGPDTTFCPNAEPLIIKDLVNENNGSATWLWNTGATTSSVRVLHEGRLSSTVKIDGCTGTDSVEVFKDCYIDIPNAFSPNGDKENDYFFPRQLLERGATSFSMDIYNRWGEKVFTTHRLDGRGWDGKFGGTDQPVGVYIYVIDVAFKNNTKEHYQGNVTLLR